MRKLILLAAVFTALIFGGLRTASAETLLGDFLTEKGIEISASMSMDTYDKYVWRGFVLDNDKVIQPAFSLSIANVFGGTLEGGYWGSWDVQNNDQFASDESDGWIGYSFDLGAISEDLAFIGISFGHTWYAFPEGDTYSKEFYAGITLDMFLSPYFTWYGDYEDENQGGADGNYYMFGIGHSLTLNEDYGITLDLGFEVGLNQDAFIVGDGGYTLTTVGMTIPLSDNVTVAPVFGYSSPFGDLADGGAGNQPDAVYGGVSVGFAM